MHRSSAPGELPIRIRIEGTAERVQLWEGESSEVTWRRLEKNQNKNMKEGVRHPKRRKAEERRL